MNTNTTPTAKTYRGTMPIPVYMPEAPTDTVAVARPVVEQAPEPVVEPTPEATTTDVASSPVPDVSPEVATPEVVTPEMAVAEPPAVVTPATVAVEPSSAPAATSVNVLAGGESMDALEDNPVAGNGTTEVMSPEPPEDPKPPRQRGPSMYHSHRKGFVLTVLLALLMIGSSVGALVYARRQAANQDAGRPTVAVSPTSVKLPVAADSLVTINGSLKVAGQSSLSTLQVSGLASLLSDLNLAGNLSVGGNGSFGGSLSGAQLRAVTLAISGNATIAGTLQATQASGNFSGNFSGNYSGNYSGSYSGNGAGLTNVNADTLNHQPGSFYLNASNLNSGTLGDNRLSGNVALRNADNTFSGTNVFASGVSLQGPLSLSQGSVIDDTAGGISFSFGGRTYTLPTSGGSNQVICTTAVTCASGAGSGVLLGPSVAQLNGSGNSAIFIDNTSGGDLLELQGNGVDKFVVNNSGDLTATSLSGNGAGLTNVDAVTLNGQNGSYYLDASNLNSGTLSDSRLSANVPLLAANNSFNGVNNFNNSSNSFTGDGSGLSNVNAAELNGQAGSYYTNATNLVSGTLDNARLNADVTLQGNTFNGSSQLVQLTAGGLLPALDGSNLSNVNAAALQGYAASYFTNASSLSSGTLSDNRLSANVPLLNAGNSFTSSMNTFVGLSATSILQNGNQVCDVSGNCAGSGTGVTATAGTSGAIALFDGSQDITSSILTQAATTVSVGGTLSATYLQGDGSAINNLSGSNITTGTAQVSVGGTGAGSFTDNGVLYGNGTGAIGATAAGASGSCLVGNGSGAPPSWESCSAAGGGGTPGGAAGGDLSGTYPNPTVSGLSGTPLSIASLSASDFLIYDGSNWVNHSLSGDLTATSNGVVTIGAGKVTNADLAHSTLGVTAGTGLTGGSSGLALGGSTSLSVTYGSAAGTAVQGSTTLICPSGSGNLTGGGNTITLGTGGSCSNLSVVASPSFTSLTLADALTAANGGTGVNGATAANGQLLIGNGSGYTLANLAQGSGISITNGAGSIEIAVDSTVCTTAGNCVGSGGAGSAIGGSGTLGTIAMFTPDGYNIGNSILTQSGTTVTVAGTLSATALQGDGSLITNLDAGNLSSGTVASARLSGSYTGITGTGALAAGSIATGFGTISTANAISTTAALQGNSLTIASGSFAVDATGAVTAATGLTSSGAVQFSSLNAAGVVHTDAAGNLTTSAVLLGTDTSGSFVANLGTLTGLTTSGNSGAASTPSLSVTYGAAVNTAAEGNTALSFTGAGNLTGTVSGTAGGGLTTNTLAVVSAPTFSGLVTANGGLSTTAVSFSGTLTQTGNGVITLGSLGAGIVQTNGSGVVSSGSIDRNSSNLTGQTSVANGGTAATTAAGARSSLGAAASGANADITALSAVASVYNTGAPLNVGTASEGLLLQGNASTTLTATDSGFTTTVGFAAPTANVTYQFATAAAGTYTICTSIGNCAGAGSGVTTAGGTTGTIALFTGSQAIGNSILTQSGTTVSVGGTLSATTLLGSGTGITDLSGSNITSGTTQVSVGGTGAGSFTSGGVLYGNGTAALGATAAGTSGECLVAVTGGAPVWQNCAGAAGGATPGGAAGGDLSGTYPNPQVSGLSGTPLSITSLAASDMLIYNGTDWANASLSGDLTVSTTGVATIANGAVTNAKLANSSLSVTAGTGLSGGGSVSLGGTTSLSVAYGSAAGTAAEGNVTFTCPSGSGNLTGGGDTITIGAGGNCSSLNVIASPSFTSLTLTDALTAANGGTGVNGATAANGSLLIGNGSGYSLANLTQGSGISITNGAGAITIAIDNTVCTTAGNCAGAGSGVTTAGGTTGTIALFTGSQAIGNSILTQSGTTVTVAGTLAATALQGDGSLVSNVNATELNGQAASYYTNAGNLSSGTVASARLSGSYTGITAVGALTGGSIGTGFGVISTGNAISTSAALQGNTLAIGSGAFAVNATGAVTAATGITSSGTVILSSLNTAGVVHTSATGQLSTGNVVLGTDTTGSYVATLGTLTGLTTSGNSGAASTPTLSVTYGATAGTAAQGNTALSFTGTGNLTGTVSGTAGGGLTTNTLAVVNAPTFSGLVTANGGLSATSVSFSGALTQTGTGVITLGSLSAGIVQTNASGVVSSGTLDRNSSNLTGQTSVANGGTAATTAAGARSSLGAAASGANADITSLTGVTSVGNTAKALTLQGNASTVLSATAGSYATTVGFIAPTANVTYQFDTAAAGTYTICTTVGNCAGAGSGVTTTGGTTGTIALFTGSQAIGNSIVTQSSTTITVAGTLSATALQGSGASITNLNGTNIASGTVGVSVGGTGVGSFTSHGIVYGNGTGALQVTTAGSTGQCLVGSTGSAPVWQSCSAAGSGGSPGGTAGGDLSGTYPNPTVAGIYNTPLAIASLASGNFLVYNGTNWVNESVTGDITVSAAGVATIGAGKVTNADLAHSTLGVTAGTGLTGGNGSLALGSSTSLSLAATTVTAGSYGSSSAVPTFTVNAQGQLTAAGTTTLANSGLQNSSVTVTGGTNLSGGGTVSLGGSITLNVVSAPTFSGVLTVTATGNSAFTGTVSGADATLSNQFATLGQLNSAVGSGSGNGNYIFNQSTQQASANFNISGSGTFGGTAYTSNVDTAAASGTLNLGATNATTVNIGSAGTAINLQSNVSVSGNLNLQSDVSVSGNIESLGNFNNAEGGIGQFQNMLTNSETIGGTGWGFVGTETATQAATTAPDGSNTASQLTQSGTTSNSYTEQTITTSSTTSSYDVSVWAKSGTISQAQFGIWDPTHSIWLVNRVFTLTSSWQRLSVTGTSTYAGDKLQFIIYAGSTVDVTTGDSVYVWGAQATQSYTPLVYTATGGTAVTTLQGGIVSNGAIYQTSATASNYFAGNLGIGTASPNTKLEVFTAGEAARFGNDTNANTYVGFANNPGVGPRVSVGYDAGSNNLALQASSGKGIEFNVNSQTFGAGTVLTIQSGGSVGIGTTSPAQKLDVNGNLRVVSGIYTGATGSGTLRLDTNGNLSNIGTYSGSGNITTTGGNVGIGTATPGSRLVVLGLTSDATTYALNVTNSGAASLLTVRDDGRVGIGTATPGQSLDVQGGNINTSGSLLTAGTTRLDASGNLSNIGTYSGSGSITTTGGVLTVQGTGSSYFTGNLGIGISNPVTKLDVLGAISTRYNNVRTYENVYSWGTASATQTGTLELILPNAWTSTMLTFHVSGYDYSTPTGGWQATVSGYNYTTASTWNYTSAQLSGNAPFTSIRLAYDSTLGKVVLLLGNTSTVWHYPQFSIDEVTAGYSNLDTWGSGYSSAFLTSESNITTVTSPVVQQTATTNQTFLQGGNSFGATAVLGTNDNNGLNLQTNGTTRLSIANSGAIGIGTSSPSQLLDVQGGSINTSANLLTAGTVRIDSSGNLQNIGTYSGSGNISTTGGVLSIQGTSLSSITGSLRVGTGGVPTFGNTLGYGGGTPQLYNSQTSGEASIGAFVNDGTNRRAKLFVDSTNGVWGLESTYSSGAIPFVITQGNNEYLRIATTGYVGIGTASPQYTLDVNGSAQFQNYLYANSKLILQTSDAYLRINQSNQFSSGIWIGNSGLRSSTGSVYLGSNGGDGQIALIPTGTDQTRRITLSGGTGNVAATSFTQSGNAVCDASGNCVGNGSAGSGIGGSGTANTIAMFNSAGTITNSAVSQSGGTVSVGANLAATGNLTATALGLGVANPQGALEVTNNSWLTSTDAAGTGTINILKVNANNEIQVGAALNIDGGIILPTDGGQMTLGDLPISSSTAAGTAESYSLQVAESNVLTVYGQADGSGNLQNGRVAIGTSNSPNYTLDVAGDINTTGVFRINGTPICTSSCAPGGGSGNYIQNQYSSAQNASLWISGTAQAAAFLNGNISITSNSIDNNNATLYLNYFNPTHAVDFQNGHVTIDGVGNIRTVGAILTGGATRLDSSGNLSNIGAYTGSGNITTTGGVLTVQGTGVSSIGGSLGVGTASPSFKLDVAGDINTSGYYRQNGVIVINTITPGSNNSFFGAGAGNTTTTGVQNTALGWSALSSLSNGSNNTAVGFRALQSATTGIDNAVVGGAALLFNTSGNYNSILGYEAGGYGASAGNSDTTGNSLLGFQAGYQLQTGANYNTLLGYTAGASLTTGTNNILIGHSVQATSATSSNQLNIGNAIYGNLSNGNVSIGSSTVGTYKLNVTGSASATTLYQGSNQVCDVSNNCGYAVGTGSTNYIQNTTTQQANSNFNISGNGTVGGTVYTSSVDTGGSGTLNLGSTNATTVNLGGGSANETINIGNSTGTDNVNIATNSGADTVNIGSSGTAINLQSGTTVNANLAINTDSANALSINNSAGAQTLGVDTTNQQVNVTNLQASGTVALQGPDGGSILLHTAANSGTGSNAMTFSGNEITDATRSADVQGDGRAAPDSSTGIWEGTTNLITNGGFESNTTGWSGWYGTTASIAQTSSTSKFGAGSMVVTSDGSQAGGGGPYSYTGVFTPFTPAQSTTYSISFWVKLPYTDSYTFIGQDGSSHQGTPQTTQVVSANTWTRITINGWVASTSHSGALVLRINRNGGTWANGDKYYLDGFQVEQKAIATPYVDTNGSVASRAGARVQAPASNLNATQGWVAERVRPSWPSAGPGPSGTPRAFNWGMYGTNTIEGSITPGTVGLVRGTTSSGGVNFNTTWNAGNTLTLIFAWTATQLGVSVNGSPFTWAAQSTIPNMSAYSTFDIGEEVPQGGQYTDSDYLWTAAGTGTLTNADAAALYKQGNSDPSLSGLNSIDSAAAPTFAWDGEGTSYSGTNNSPTLQSGITIDDATLYHNMSGSLAVNSSFLIQPAADSTSAFQVQNAAGTATVLGVDTVNGRVGIGTAAPSALFSVGSSSQLQVDGSGNLTTSGLIVSTGTAGANSFASNVNITKFSSGSLLAVTQSGSGSSATFMGGNVGIGTTAPADKLDVQGGNIIVEGTGSSANPRGLKVRYNTTDTNSGSLSWNGLQLGNNGTNYIVAGNSSANGSLRFVVNNTNSLGAGTDYGTNNGTTAMTILSNGNIGIGTTTPGQLLDVQGGNINTSGNLMTGGTLRLDSTGNLSNIGTYSGSGNIVTTGGTIVSSRLGFAGTYNSAQVQGIWSIGTGFAINTASNTFGTLYGLGYTYNTTTGQGISGMGHEIDFLSNGTTNAAISLSNGSAYFNGGIGIGTAPSATQMLQVGATTNSQYSDLGTNDLTFNRANNSYISNANTSGLLRIGVGAVSTSAVGITINAANNVGIGTASPGQLLDVQGGNINTSGYYYQGGNIVVNTTTATANTFIGANAGNTSTTGTGNVAVGASALQSNTTGLNNTAVGRNALITNTTGTLNTALGQGALQTNNANNNTAVGYNALFNISSGSNNTGFGSNAGRYLQDGSSLNQTSNNSIYLGYDTTAQANGDTNEIVIGAGATGSGSNTVTLGNSSITQTVLQGNITGSGTINLTGTGNSSLMGPLGLGTSSPQAGSALTVANGSWLSAVDSTGSGFVNILQVNSNNEIQLGAALNVDGGIILPTDGGQMTLSDLPIDANAAAGTPESYSLRVGSANVLTVYGEADGAGNLQNGRVAIGSSISPQYPLDVSGDINTSGSYRINGVAICTSGCAPGSGSGYYIQNTTSLQSSANFNISGNGYIGGNAGIGTTSPSQKLDVQGGNINTSGYYMQGGLVVVNTLTNGNSFIGPYAGNLTTTGSLNTATGASTLLYDTTGSYNTATGSHALISNTTGSYNTAIGELSLAQNDIGSWNTAVGFGAASGCASACGISGNTLLGYDAGYNLQAGGDYNTLLGIHAGSNITTGNNNIIIGPYASAPIATGSNQLNIGNVLYGDTSAGTAYLKTSSTTAFQIQNSAGSSLFNADTSNSQISIGGPAATYSHIAVPASPLGFYGHADYATGAGSWSAAEGDFNGDSSLDLAVANTNVNTISIMINSGSGVFTKKTDYTVTSPVDVVTGDFNGDGRADLAVLSSGGTVTILTGNGDGTFTAGNTYSTYTDAVSITTGDFNDDGHLDLAVLTDYVNQTNYVYVLTNNGTGTFTSTYYTLPAGATNPTQIVSADLSGDGKPDLIIANGNNTANSVSVMTNKGNGTFNSQINYSPGSSFPEDIAVGDFNGDGKLDVAAGIWGTKGYSVMLGNGDGTLQTGSFTSTGIYPYSITAGDFNGDGKQDIALGDYEGNAVAVYLNNGNGTFTSAGEFATGNYPHKVIAGDLNGDGKLDIATANPGDGTVSVLINNIQSAEPAVSYSSSLSVTAASSGTGGLIVQGVSGQTADLLVLQDSSGNGLLTVDANGNLAAKGTITGGVASPDYAENITASDLSIGAGDVVAADPAHPGQVIKASTPYSSSVMGVISTHPGFVTNSSGVDKNDPTQRPLALSGRVPVKVSTENGPIQPGDYLTSSDIPGVAMKATGSGPVIGMAMASFDGTGADATACGASGQYMCGTVLFFINPSSSNPAGMASVMQGGDATLNALTVNGALAADSINVGGLATAGSLTVTGDAAIGGNLTVGGDLTVGGGLTVAGMTNVMDITVDGHIITAGNAPTVQVLTAAAGTGATVTVDGNDTAGTITIQTGAKVAHTDSHGVVTYSGNDPAAGDMANVTFAQSYGKTPRILITPADGRSAPLLVYPDQMSATGFSFSFANLPAATSSYNFEYFIVQ